MRVAAFVLVIGLLLSMLVAGRVLSRIDRAQLAAHRAHEHAAEVSVRLEQLRQDLAARPAAPDHADDLRLSSARIEVLRRVIWTLVSAGVHWPPDFRGMPSLEGTLWPALPVRGWDLQREPMRIVGGEPR